MFEFCLEFLCKLFTSLCAKYAFRINVTSINSEEREFTFSHANDTTTEAEP